MRPTLAFLSLAAAASLGAGARPLLAQPGACDGCTAATAGMAHSLRADADRLRDEVAALRRERAGDEAETVLREVEGALARLDPMSPSASSQLARARSLVSRELSKRADDTQMRWLYGRLAGLYAQLGAVRAVQSAERSMEERLAMARARTEHRTTVRTVDAPRGYMGITFSSTTPRTDPVKGMYFIDSQYPVVVSVDPGSPAARAGLAAGDTIIAFNTQSVRGRPVYIAQLLTPGNVVGVKVRRAGQTYEVAVPVAERPRTDAVVVPAPGVAGGWRMMPPTPPASPAAPRAPRAPRAPTSAVAPTPPAPPSRGVGAAVFDGEGGETGMVVAGAQLAPMGDQLRETFGVRDRGVLVLGVARGTPAAASGLRGGDVIVSADERRVESPGAFRRAVAAAEADGRSRLTLEVVRRREKVEVELRW